MVPAPSEPWPPAWLEAEWRREEEYEEALDARDRAEEKAG